ncbi:MAG: LysR family transcriptional regulator [Bacillota bacterium]|nr:LysR family transcriptional regulator [Bacillota bacterium]
MNCFSSVNYILAIAEARNISIAAEQLKISQPALSAQLKKLEKELGAVLFDRNKHPLEITEAGKIYLDYAARYQVMNKEFTQHLADLSELKSGKLTIGGAASFNVSYLPETVAEFTKKYPGIDLDIVDGSIPEIAAKTLSGQIDLFIASTLEPDDRLNYEELLEEKIFLCVPSQWELNDDLVKWQIPVEDIIGGEYGAGEELPAVNFTSFKDSTFILLNRDQQIGHTMNSLFDKYDFDPKKTVMAEQTMTSYSLTLAGVGISLMTESTIRYSNFKEHPKFYMADLQICKRKIYVAYSAQKYLSTAARTFMDLLEKNLRQ